jgi:hypothetical protein
MMSPEVEIIFTSHNQGYLLNKNGVYYIGIKIFNHLPSFIKDLSDNKNQFKIP